MKERLIELCDTNCGYVDEMSAEKFADYLIDNGVVAFPCKIGQEIWEINYRNELEKVRCSSLTQRKDGKLKIRVSTSHMSVYERKAEDFGKTMFLTKKEAEIELAKRNKEKK